VDIIIILAAGISTQVFGKYVGIQYAYTKKPFWIFPVTVLGTISNVVLNILLIPVLGLIGAGLATMASLTITNLVLTFIGQKLYKIPYEWKIIVSLYALIVVATLTILYFRAMNFSNINLYPLKLIFLIAFLFIGIKAKIVTRESITKVSGALFKFSKA
jgi:O-antigen/teichoic acid export membrane protein